MELISFIVGTDIELKPSGRFRIGDGGIAQVHYQKPTTYSCKGLLVLHASRADIGDHPIKFVIYNPDGTVGASGERSLENPAQLPPDGRLPSYNIAEGQCWGIPGTEDREIILKEPFNWFFNWEGVSKIEIWIDGVLAATRSIAFHRGAEPKPAARK